LVLDRWDDFDFNFGLHRNEVDVIAAGLNHQTWFTKVQFRGEDLTVMLPELMGAIHIFSKPKKSASTCSIASDTTPLKSNDQLSEYLPWYRKRTGEINQWIDLSNWINNCSKAGLVWYCSSDRALKITAGVRSMALRSGLCPPP
jgi:alpha-galactosidase